MSLKYLRMMIIPDINSSWGMHTTHGITRSIKMTKRYMSEAGMRKSIKRLLYERKIQSPSKLRGLSFAKVLDVESRRETSDYYQISSGAVQTRKCSRSKVSIEYDIQKLDSQENPFEDILIMGDDLCVNYDSNP